MALGPVGAAFPGFTGISLPALRCAGGIPLFLWVQFVIDAVRQTGLAGGPQGGSSGPSSAGSFPRGAPPPY